jgi:hypothetical protein
MAVRIVQNLCDSLVSRSEIVANSAALVVGGFVSLSGGYLIPATTTGKLEGASNETYTAASDNQTVAKYKGSYTVSHPGTRYEVDITGGTVTQADVGKYYNLSTSVLVDGTTEATAMATVPDDGIPADPVTFMQLRLVEFKSATLGVFEIV